MWLPERTADQVTLGVAISVPEPYRAELIRARLQSQDPLALTIPPHITVLGPTAVRQHRLTAVADHLAAVARRHHPFVVRLAGTETFRPVSPVVFVALAAGADRCAALQADVNSGPLAQQLRFPYHPHVTIAHEAAAERLDAAEEEFAGFAAEWAVGGFELYEHGDDGVWRVMETFPLHA